MSIIRVLDTSETLPSLSSTAIVSNDSTVKYQPSTHRPLLTDSERTRQQKNTERLRRKRQKRANLRHQQAALKERAKTDIKAKVRLDKQNALQALERARGVIIDKSARPGASGVLFKKNKNGKPLLRKDQGFSKRGTKKKQ